MSSLSQKDKNTLILAVIALLIFGIAFLGIKPAVTGIKETKAVNSELSAKKAEMKTEIDSLATYKTQLDSAKADYAKTGDRVFDCNKSDLIHDSVVAFVQETGLQVNSFAISAVQVLTIADYKIIEGVDDTATEGGETDGTITLATIQVGVFGSTDQVIKLLDKINSTEGAYLKDVSFSDSEETTQTSISFDIVIEDTFA